MSDIKTLVDDIYKLFDDNNKEPTKSDLNMFAKNVCESIKTYLTEDNIRFPEVSDPQSKCFVSFLDNSFKNSFKKLEIL